MARIIGVVNQKGGVGKTTTAVNLGAYLALHGKYVLLIDLDPQANASSGLGVRFSETELEGQGAGKIEPTLYDALMNNVPILEVIRKTSFHGYDIIPSGSDLAGAAVELVGRERREFALYDLLHTVRGSYDYILIDSPPSLGLLTINGLVATEQLLIPIQCEYYALEGLGQLLKTVDLIKNNITSSINIMGVVLTMYDKRNLLSRQVEKEVRRNFQGKVFNSIISRNVELAEAPSYGKSILLYKPNSAGARNYSSLAKEIIAMEQKIKYPKFTI